MGMARPFGFAPLGKLGVYASLRQGQRGGQEAEAGKLPHSISNFIISGGSRECRVPGAECRVPSAGFGLARCGDPFGKLRVALRDSKGEKAGKPRSPYQVSNSDRGKPQVASVPKLREGEREDGLRPSAVPTN